MSEFDKDLEMVFKKTDEFINTLADKLGRTHREVIMAVEAWLEARSKDKFCRIVVPKTKETVAAMCTLENIGIVFDVYLKGGETDDTFVVTTELYDGDQSNIEKIHQAVTSALEESCTSTDELDWWVGQHMEEFKVEWQDFESLADLPQELSRIH